MLIAPQHDLPTQSRFWCDGRAHSKFGTKMLINFLLAHRNKNYKDWTFLLDVMPSLVRRIDLILTRAAHSSIFVSLKNNFADFRSARVDTGGLKFLHWHGNLAQRLQHPTSVYRRSAHTRVQMSSATLFVFHDYEFCLYLVLTEAATNSLKVRARTDLLKIFLYMTIITYTKDIKNS